MVIRPIELSQLLGGAFAAISLFAYQWMNIDAGAWLLPVFAAVTAMTLAVSWQKGDTLRTLLARSQSLLPSWSATTWLVAAVALGISIRLALATAFPAALVSDAQQYLDLAHKLADGEAYSTAEGYAYWPPGLPLALLPLYAAFEQHAVLIYNLITFVLATLITFWLGLKLANRQVASLSAVFMAIWPNFVFATPILSKECLLIVLWPAAVYFYLQASESNSDIKAGVYALFAGALIGYAALTQPSGALLGACFALFSLLTTGWRRQTAICVFAAACGAVAVVTPWTVRNYEVLHAFVPIASEGGVNFFMVTQQDSDGRWSDNYDSTEGAAYNLGIDEVSRQERGLALGFKSIGDHPLHFLSTVLRKPFYLFGQDIKNVYFVFERGRGGTTRQYAVAYWIANGFYLIFILLITIFAVRKGYRQDTPPALLLLWMFTLYPIFAHSLFEAAERHRYGGLGFMAIFAAMAFCPSSSQGRSHVSAGDGSPISSIASR